MLTIKIPSGVKSIGWLKSLSLGFNNFIFKTEKGGGGGSGDSNSCNITIS